MKKAILTLMMGVLTMGMTGCKKEEPKVLPVNERKEMTGLRFDYNMFSGNQFQLSVFWKSDRKMEQSSRFEKGWDRIITPALKKKGIF